MKKLEDKKIRSFIFGRLVVIIYKGRIIFDVSNNSIIPL